MAYIVKQPAGRNRCNIFLAENHYVPEKKSSRQTRKYIGILAQESGELLLAENQHEPNEELLNLLAVKGIKYSGKRTGPRGRKQINPRRKLSLNVIGALMDKSDIIEVGRVNAFRHLANESGLFASLCDSFKDDIADKIISAAIFQASEGMPLYLAADWIDETGFCGGLSSANISRVLSGIGADVGSLNKFFSSWIKACGSPNSVIHDTTSISSNSVSADDIEWGYNRDREALAQINIALVVGRVSRLPLWFRLVSGSIPDVASLNLTFKILQSLGLKEFSFSLDRGYYSCSNIFEMDKNKIGFTIGVPPSTKQYSKIVSENQSLLDSNKSSFLFNQRRMRHAESAYTLENSKGEKKSFYAHVFLDLEKRESESNRLEVALLQLVELAKKEKFETRIAAERWINDNTAKYARFLEIQEDKARFGVARNTAAISKEISGQGTFMIISDRDNLGPVYMLEEYRCRDIAEKIFDVTKNGVGFNRLRTSEADQINGRVFLAFVAVILRTLFELKLKQSDLLKKFTVDEALSKLRKIKIITLSDGRIVQREIPKQARIIKEAIEKKAVLG